MSSPFSPKVDLVSMRLQQRMLHVVVVEQDCTFAVAIARELFQPLNVPIVVLREIILRQSVKHLSLSAANPRLLEKRRLDIDAIPLRIVVRITSPDRTTDQNCARSQGSRNG